MICRRFLTLGVNVLRQSSILKQTQNYVTVNRLCAFQSSTAEVFNSAKICEKFENNPNFKSLLETIDSLGLDKQYIIESIEYNPKVLSIDPDRTSSILRILVEFGLDENIITNCIVSYPEIFSSSEKHLNDSLLLWSQMRFSQKLLYTIMKNHPNLIDKMNHNFSERIRFLLPYLENHDNVAKVILLDPRVLLESWDTLKAKLDYLNSINIFSEKIANCGGLGLSLNQMKSRFEFLRRAGVYKDIQLKKKMLTANNPTLDRILSSDDKDFAKNVARLSLIEFETFSELYERELEREDYENEEDYEYDSE